MPDTGGMVAGFTAGLVGALEAAWAAIQARHPQVPPVVLTIGSGTAGMPSGQLRLGHFAAARWELAGGGERAAELFVSGEGLRLGAVDVMGTLLHEAAHGLAYVRGIQDTSRQGRYHNARYRALAIELGQTVVQAGSIGWSDTALTPAAQAAYQDQIGAIRAALVAFRHPEATARAASPAPGGPGTPGPDNDDGGDTGSNGAVKEKNGVVATCGCPRRIRITRSVLDTGPITCGLCHQPFTAAPRP